MPPKSAKKSTQSKYPGPSKRLRNYCLTINNWTESDVNNLLLIPHKYLIYGKQLSSTGTPHLQIYLQLKEASTMSALSKKLPKSHIEPAVYSPEECIEYCKKNCAFKESGSYIGQGHRSDIDEVRTLALSGGMRAVTRVCTFGQIKVAESFLTYNETPRTWKPHVFYIHGPAGVGKGRLADAIFEATTGQPDDIFVICPLPSDDASEPYEKSDPSKWWNGYDGHPNVIIDDFRGSWWPLTYLLKLLDRRKFQVENKGGMRQFKAFNIIITSIHPPEECYKKCFAQTATAPIVDVHIDKVEKMMEGRRTSERCSNIPSPSDRVKDDSECLFEGGEPKEQLLRRIDEIIELKYTFDTENNYIEHQAAYINRKLKGTHHLCGRNTTAGIVKFNIDPSPTTRGYK